MEQPDVVPSEHRKRAGAWVSARNNPTDTFCRNIVQAGFPTVEQLGLFKVDSWPAPLWLYQVRLHLNMPAPAQTIRLAADGEKHV